ncbi:MAG TPA: ABC transporter permease [Spirochaetales bacterium]|nr:ABC transporter permease [Spirochaetales bacterium]
MGLIGIIIKEFKHIARDYRTLIVLFGLPLLQMILFGYAMDLEIKNINLKIDDYDKSSLSRELKSRFEGSKFFSISAGHGNLNELFQKRLLHAVVTIPDGFAEDLNSGRVPSIDVIIDGSDSNRAVIIRQYISGIIMGFSSSLRSGDYLPLNIIPSYAYNAELNSAFFFVPGLTALIIIMVSALLTSMTIAREKEQGTFDLIKLSPVHAYEVILGKVIPYLVLSILIGMFVIVCGVVLFGVPIRGSYGTLLFYLFIYCLTGLSFGMLISTIVSTQQSAMLIAMIATLLPTLFLSGFIFQLEAMPKLLQMISWLIPAKYFLVIIRGLMLKGNSQSELMLYISLLLLFSIIFLGISIRRFKAYLES